jgi:hypothetical protein
LPMFRSAAVSWRKPSPRIDPEVIAAIALLSAALVVGLSTVADYGLTVERRDPKQDVDPAPGLRLKVREVWQRRVAEQRLHVLDIALRAMLLRQAAHPLDRERDRLRKDKLPTWVVDCECHGGKLPCPLSVQYTTSAPN